MIRTGSAILEIGKTKVEIYQLQEIRYIIYVSRDGIDKTYYPKNYTELEEVINIISEEEVQMTTYIQISNEDRNLICNLARSIILAKDAGYPYFTLPVDGIRANAIIALATKIVG